MTSRRSLARNALGVLALGTAALGYSALIERRSYTLREVTIPVLPHGSPDLRILHLSDLHITPRQLDKVSWVNSLAFLEPDLVIDTGDNVGSVDAIPTLEAALAPLLRSAPGVYVDGSNDLYAPRPKNPLRYVFPRTTHVNVEPTREPIDISALHAVFDSSSWANLNNEATEMQLGSLPVLFVGTGDAHLGHANLDIIHGRRPQIRAARDAGALIVGVTHAPYQAVLDALVDAGVDVIFAGHTHGGQVCVPGLGALTTNCDLPLKQAKGASRWRHAGRCIPLHVSAGLGTSIYAPVRFACPPEATLVTLTATHLL